MNLKTNKMKTRLFLGERTEIKGGVIRHGKFNDACFDLTISDQGEISVLIVDALGKVQNNQTQFNGVKSKIVREFVAVESGFMDFDSYAKVKPGSAAKLGIFSQKIINN